MSNRQIHWVHGCTVKGETTNPANLAAEDFGTRATAGSPPPHLVRIAVPCPTRINGVEGKAHHAYLKYRAYGPGNIMIVRLMDGVNLVETWPPPTFPPHVPGAVTQLSLPVQPTVNIESGLALSIELFLPAGSTVDIIGAGVEVSY